MTVKIITPNGGADSLDFGCARTAIVATVTGTEVSSGEGKLELKTTTGGTSATKVTIAADGKVGINKTAPVTKLHIEGGGTSLPATTGTTPSAGTTLRIRPGNNAILDIGGNSTSGAWLQSYDQTGMQTEYPLLLNPNGGAVTLGTPLAITSGGMGVGTGERIIQVVTGTTSTAVVSSSSTYADTGITATITPKFASSKILVITTIAGLFKSAGHSDNRIGLNLIRDSTTINTMLAVLWTQGTAIFLRSSYAHQDLDSPNTTSAVTYKWQFSNEQNVASVAVQRDSNSGNSVITLMEIAS